MGCHTWFYKPLNRPFREAQRLALEYMAKYPHSFNAQRKKNKRLIEKGGFGCMPIVWEYQPETIHIFDGKPYIADSLFDLWRCGYSDIECGSLGETLDFINAHRREIGTSFQPDWETKLINWWRDNPNGKISFG